MKKAVKIHNNLIQIKDFPENESGEQLSQYKDYISSPRPNFDEETESLKLVLIEDKNEIREEWHVVKNVVEINKKIEELKSELLSTDYIIIKSYEAKLSMNDNPYSKDYLDEVIQKRQELRDKINELEKLLKI